MDQVIGIMLVIVAIGLIADKLMFHLRSNFCTGGGARDSFEGDRITNCSLRCKMSLLALNCRVGRAPSCPLSGGELPHGQCLARQFMIRSDTSRTPIAALTGCRLRHPYVPRLTSLVSTTLQEGQRNMNCSDRTPSLAIVRKCFMVSPQERHTMVRPVSGTKGERSTAGVEGV
jgi:hypothetical protein